MPLLRTTLAFAASALLGGPGAAAAGSGGGAAAAAGATAAAAKPNLIFILAVRSRRPACPPSAALTAAVRRQDDLGHNDVGWANKRTITPHLDSLVRTGVELTQWYVFKYCAPTRGMLMTGRFPYHFGFCPIPRPCRPSPPLPPPTSPLLPARARSRPCLPDNNQDANDYGVPLNYTMLPAALKEGGNYRTHAIGKWCAPRRSPYTHCTCPRTHPGRLTLEVFRVGGRHMGFRSESLNPTRRGYDTFLGYYHMGEDYFTHRQSVKLQVRF